MAPFLGLTALSRLFQVRVNVPVWRRLCNHSSDVAALCGAVNRAALGRDWLSVQNIELQLSSGWTEKSDSEMSMLEQVSSCRVLKTPTFCMQIAAIAAQKLDPQLAAHPVLVSLVPVFAEVRRCTLTAGLTAAGIGVTALDAVVD